MSAPDDDANSADHTMNKMDEMTPEAIILGGISPSDLSFHRLGDLTYMHSCKTQLQPLEQKTVIGRKRISHFFQHQVLQSPNVYYEDETMETLDVFTGAGDHYGDEKSTRDFRLYRAEPDGKRKIWLSQLTAARM